MRVTVDEETCIGCGLCAETCPEVFEMNDEKARVKVDEVPEIWRILAGRRLMIVLWRPSRLRISA